MIPVTVRAIYPSQKAKSCPSLQLHTTEPSCTVWGDGHTPSVTILAPKKVPDQEVGEMAETRYAWGVIVLPPERTIIARPYRSGSMDLAG